MQQVKIKTDTTYNLYILNNMHDSDEVLAYRAFCLLKAVDAQNGHSGFIPTEDANKVIKYLIGKNYSVETLQRVPAINKYFTIQRKGIRLNSWFALQSETLNVDNENFSEWSFIPKTAFSKKSTFLACLYISWLDNRIIARDTITAITGLSKSTQIRYEKKTLTKKEFVFLKLSHQQLDEEIERDTVNSKAIVKQTSSHVYIQASNRFESTSTNREFKKSSKGYKTRIKLADSKRAKTNPLNGAIRFLDDRFENIWFNVQENKLFGKINATFQKRVENLPTFTLTNETLFDGKVYELANYTAFSMS